MPDEIPLSTKVLQENDQSSRVLDQLFGSDWDTVTGHNLTTSAASMAHDLLSAFNWVALAAVSVLFVIVMAQGVTGTANEGVALGKRYSSLWMPLRFAFSMSFLAPIIKGMSIFQAFLLLSVGYSINLANYAWTRGMNFFVDTAGQVTLQAPETLRTTSRAMGGGILEALVTQEYFSEKMELPISGPYAREDYISQNDGAGSGGHWLLTFSVPSGSGLSPGSLGRITIPCVSQSDVACDTQLSAVRQYISSLVPLAQKLVDLETPLATGDSGLLAGASQDYEMTVRPAISMVLDENANELKSQIASLRDRAVENGWFTAGGYYWNISRFNEKAAQAIYSTPTFSRNKAVTKELDSKTFPDFESTYNRAENYTVGAFRPERELNIREAEWADEYSYGWLMDKLQGIFTPSGAIANVVQKMSHEDPISTMTSFGHYVVGASTVLIGTTVAAKSATAMLQRGTENVFARVFTGDTAGIKGAGIEAAATEIIGWLKLISILSISYGFFMSYFLPAIPYVIWISAIMGWLILVMESLVAAPLWVAAHALPEGEGLTGSSGRQGYMLFLGVVLRPPLMVAGFLIAMSLINGIGRGIGYIFLEFGYDYITSSGVLVSIGAFFAFAVILGITIIVAAYKIFGLISYLPEKVTNWIGQQLHSLGESGDAHSAAGQYGGAGGYSNKVVGGAGAIQRPYGYYGRGPGGEGAEQAAANRVVPDSSAHV